MEIFNEKLLNSYVRLPDIFFSYTQPTPVKNPKTIVFNEPLSDILGLYNKNINENFIAQTFSGNNLPSDSTPISQAYAGHQFGYFSMLGDGRAILIGEVKAKDGKLFDIQLKGSGPTPYSRNGDGRAALGPMLREYLISEAMYSLGIPTTRSLAVVSTGETISRETRLPGAILTRTASSHLRVGTFQYSAASQDIDSLNCLTDYTIARHYPEAKITESAPLSLLEQVIIKQAELITEWMRVGFIHGVMNTDNMTISGETIDYGPCAFMDDYNPKIAFSSIDHNNRYSFENQPSIANWNLARFAESLIPIIHPDKDEAIKLATKKLSTFKDIFHNLWLSMMKRKIGLTGKNDEDSKLIWGLLDWMSVNKVDYTNLFVHLTYGINFNDETYNQKEFIPWKKNWKSRIKNNSSSQEDYLEVMKKNNPIYIPRNHLVELAIDAAQKNNDITTFNKLLTVVTDPYNETTFKYDYMEPSPDGLVGYKTYCGT